MMEFIFKDMEYVRVFDWMADFYSEFDAFEISKDTFIPDTKVTDVLQDFRDLGMVKFDNSKGVWSVIRESKMFKCLTMADFEGSKIYAESLSEKESDKKVQS